MKRILLVSSFFVGNFLLLGISAYLLAISPTNLSNGHARGYVTIGGASSTYQSFSAVPRVLAAFSEAQIKANDARPILVDDFLTRYHSPFQGLGQFIVDVSDKYRIPYGLIPAIAQCESNVGKVVPIGSHNAWGYGVYGSSVLRFDNWFEAIERVGRGLRTDYFDQGLDTPEKIMPKYTPPSNGSWARCVNEFLAELQ